MIWVYLNGRPVRQFYSDARAAELLSSTHARHQLLRSVSPLRDDTEGETANLSIELDNRGGTLTTLFARPPLGVEVTVYDGSAAVFEGVVIGLSLSGDSATLGCVA